jgi:hypothetical protein
MTDSQLSYGSGSVKTVDPKMIKIILMHKNPIIPAVNYYLIEYLVRSSPFCRKYVVPPSEITLI